MNVYSLVSIGSVSKVTKRNGKYRTTKEEVINLIFSMHSATGHGVEKKTHKKIQDKFANSCKLRKLSPISCSPGVNPPVCQSRAKCIIEPLTTLTMLYLHYDLNQNLLMGL